MMTTGRSCLQQAGLTTRAEGIKSSIFLVGVKRKYYLKCRVPSVTCLFKTYIFFSWVSYPFSILRGLAVGRSLTGPAGKITHGLASNPLQCASNMNSKMWKNPIAFWNFERDTFCYFVFLLSSKQTFSPFLFSISLIQICSMSWEKCNQLGNVNTNPLISL